MMGAASVQRRAVRPDAAYAAASASRSSRRCTSRTRVTPARRIGFVHRSTGSPAVRRSPLIRSRSLAKWTALIGVHPGHDRVVGERLQHHCERLGRLHGTSGPGTRSRRIGPAVHLAVTRSTYAPSCGLMRLGSEYLPNKRSTRRRRRRRPRSRTTVPSTRTSRSEGVSRREFWLSTIGTWIVTWISARQRQQPGGAFSSAFSSAFDSSAASSARYGHVTESALGPCA